MEIAKRYNSFGKVKSLLLLAVFFCLAACNVCLADVNGFDFTVDTDHPDAIYKCGETMKFKIQLLEKDAPALGRKLTWVRKGDDGKVVRGEFVSGPEPVTITTSIDKPGFVSLDVTILGEDGKPLKIKNGKTLTLHCGAGAEPEKLSGVPEPEDFDKFWAAQKEALGKVEISAKMEPIKTKNQNLDGFDIKVDCAGGMPVSGYYFKPKNAKPRSLPAMVLYHGYGVGGASKNEGWTVKGMLCLDINAHGIENGKSKEFYDNLKKNELKRYGFNNNDKPETSYFLGMYLRVMRSLQFMKNQPEWDGKNLFVYGGSQGGAQAMAAAGLDEDVTVCYANKPWLCDLGGVKLGRLSGWRPAYTEALRYFDPANMAKRVKARTFLDIGLGDYVCPPSGVYVAFNNLACEKSIKLMQAATHGGRPSFQQPGGGSAFSAFDQYLKSVIEK